MFEGEKGALSETCTDLLHYIESFAEHENQSLIHLWLLEDSIQDINTNTCGLFQTYFYENLFLPSNDNVLHIKKRLIYDVVQEFLQELFTTDTEQNEKIIKQYREQQNIKVKSQQPDPEPAY